MTTGLKYYPEYNKIIAVVLFFLCPIFSLPFILQGIYEKKKYAFILLAFFMGICSLVLIPPRGDLYRHSQMFYMLSEYSWSDFMQFLESNFKIDFLLYLVFWLYAHLGITFGWVRLTLVVISYLLFFNIYHYYSQEQEDRKYCFKVFCILFLIVPYEALAMGARFAFATVLVTYFYYIRYIRSIKSYWNFLLLIIAFYFHFAVLPLIVLFFLSSFLSFGRNRKFYILIAIISFLFSGGLLANLVTYLPIDENLSLYLSNYISGEYAGNDYVPGMSFFYWLPTYISWGIIVVILYYMNKISVWDRNIKFLFLFLVVLSLLVFSFAIFNRACLVFTVLGIIIILRYSKKLNLLLYSLVFLFLINLYATRRDMWLNRWEFLFFPVPALFYADYTEQWIQENIDADGSPYIFNK